MAVPAWLIGIAYGAVARSRRRTAYPPGPDAVRPEQARARAASFAALAQPQRSDLAIEFAPTIATSAEPLLHGHRRWNLAISLLNRYRALQ